MSIWYTYNLDSRIKLFIVVSRRDLQLYLYNHNHVWSDVRLESYIS